MWGLGAWDQAECGSSSMWLHLSLPGFSCCFGVFYGATVLMEQFHPGGLESAIDEKRSNYFIHSFYYSTHPRSICRVSSVGGKWRENWESTWWPQRRAQCIMSCLCGCHFINTARGLTFCDSMDLIKLKWLNSQHDGRIHRNNGCPHSSYKERHHIILLLGVIKIALILQWANGSWERWWGQAVVSRRRDLQEFTNEDMKMSKHNWSIKTCPRAWICRSAFFKKMPQYMYLIEIIIIGIWKMAPGYKSNSDGL